MDSKIKLIGFLFAVAVILGWWIWTSQQNNQLSTEESNELLQPTESLTNESKNEADGMNFTKLDEPAKKTINLSARFLEQWVFNASGYKVVEPMNLSLLVIPHVYSDDSYEELMLPAYHVNTAYPLKTIITNVTILSMEDPVDLSLPNLPMWGEGNYASRLDADGKCRSNIRHAGLTYRYAYAEDRVILAMTLRPVEVVDCEKGLFRLYQRITFGVYYYVYSPVLLDVRYYPKHLGPGEKVTFPVRVVNVVNDTVPGTIFLELKGVGRIFEQNISIDSAKEAYYNISFEAPRSEGEYQYNLCYFLDNETRINQSFWPYVRLDYEGSSKVV